MKMKTKEPASTNQSVATANGGEIIYCEESRKCRNRHRKCHAVDRVSRVFMTKFLTAPGCQGHCHGSERLTAWTV